MSEKESNPANPKDSVAAGKLPLHLWPSTATAMGCIGMLNGREKYGRSNYRAVGVLASVYADACKRHIDAWFEGEEADPDDGVPHLAAALCCLAIIVDARAAGKLNDDRMVAGGYRRLVTELTPHVARLKALHAAKSPRHYTIKDNTKEDNECHPFQENLERALTAAANCQERKETTKAGEGPGVNGAAPCTVSGPDGTVCPRDTEGRVLPAAALHNEAFRGALSVMQGWTGAGANVERSISRKAGAVVGTQSRSSWLFRSPSKR